MEGWEVKYVEKEVVRSRFCLCIRSVLIKNVYYESFWGGEKKKDVYIFVIWEILEKR